MIWRIILVIPVLWIIVGTVTTGLAEEKSDGAAKNENIVGKSHGYCNQTFTHKSGSFYPNNATNASSFYCEYILKGNGSICVFFQSLFLDEGDEVNFYRFTDKVENGTKLTETIKAQNGSVTVITGLSSVAVVITGHNPSYIRSFEAYYTHECIIPVPPDVTILHSPIYAANAPQEEVRYSFNKIQHKRVKQAFTVMEYSMAESKLSLEGGTADGPFEKDPPPDFLTLNDKPVLALHVTMKPNSSDHFWIKIVEVDSTCSDLVDLESEGQIKQLRSPPEVLNNGTIVPECRWIIKHRDSSKILGLTFDTLDFHDVFDIVTVNNGLSERSPALFQVTVSNRNASKNQVFRSGASGPYLWVAFKPIHFASRFVANITVHGQGGYIKNEGKISMKPTTGDDTAFLLEVKTGEVVMLSFEDSSFTFPAALSIYDGFEARKESLLATLHSQIKYPILSKSSRMMLIGTNFSASSSHFTANFKGGLLSCDQMSTLTSGNYILSESCGSNCTWILPPQDVQNADIVIYLQYQSLKKGDTVVIRKLDGNLTQLGLITSETGYVPSISVPAAVGAVVTVAQAACKVQTGKIVLIGHSSLLPGQSINLSPKPSEVLQIASPLYPDNYPAFSTHQWNITAPKDTFFYLAFLTMKLAPNHCIKISGKENFEFTGTELPDDLILHGDIRIQFQTSGCSGKPDKLSLVVDEGFQLNLTVAECGGVLTGKSGEFNTSMTGQKSVCIWKIDVSEKDSVRAVSYSVNQKDALTNQEMTVYDGASVRDTPILNNTKTELMSRTPALIVKYVRLNVSKPSSLFMIKYNTEICNSSMQCDNKVCMHADWRCNGVNDCGDFSDERNCLAVPVPKQVIEGYSPLAFWLCLFAMLFIGILISAVVPTLYQRYKDSRYSRFSEFSGIDN